VTLSKGNYVWVSANFKETQLAEVRPGEPAEVEVDGFPGKIFRGKVRAITAATGASTALLPPDNATGNFTKVVQRIPVRIELSPSDEGGNYANKDDIANLRQGMSVTATIDTGDYLKYAAIPAEGGASSNAKPGGDPGSSTPGQTAAPSHVLSRPRQAPASDQAAPSTGGN
jgi:membrane fusion protein (multidrug efflux system)